MTDEAMKNPKNRWSNTGSTVHLYNVHLILSVYTLVFPSCQSVTVATHRWRSTHFEKPRPSSGLSITKCHRLHGVGDELQRKAPLPVLEPGE